MLKWINVKELVPVELDESKSIGMMRLDQSGSRRDEVCNQWLPSQQFDDVVDKYNISIPALQVLINELIFEQLDVFSKVIDRCRGEGYRYEQLFKVETTDFNFYLRLKPVKDEYSYLFIYHR